MDLVSVNSAGQKQSITIAPLKSADLIQRTNTVNYREKKKKKSKYPGEIFLLVDVTQLLTLPLSDFFTALLQFPYSTFVSINCSPTKCQVAAS